MGSPRKAVLQSSDPAQIQLELLEETEKRGVKRPREEAK
jgi:hypothetical protein